MKIIKPLIRALCTGLAVCMIFFAGISTFADNNSASDPVIEKKDNHKKYLEEAVEKLVEEGSLTREKADKILEYKQKIKIS